MATERLSMDDAMALLHAYGKAGDDDERVCELAKAYVHLLQTVEMQTQRLGEAIEVLQRAHQRLGGS